MNPRSIRLFNIAIFDVVATIVGAYFYTSLYSAV